MKILIISSCTKSKEPAPAPAREFYRGRQHMRIDIAAKAAQRADIEVDWRIVSAKYGLVAASQLIEPYEQSFGSMSRAQRIELGKGLYIPQKLYQLFVRVDYDHIYIALGNDYLIASGFAAGGAFQFSAPTVAYCSYEFAARLEKYPRVRAVPLGNREAKKHGIGLIELKGFYLQNEMDRLIELNATNEV